MLHAQQALSRQLTALSTALAKAVAAGTGSGRGGGTGPDSGSGGNPAGPGGSGHSSAPVSAAQLAADQATADADAAQLTVAQQDLANATVRSPIGGTVVSVEVSAGTAVTAGSAAFEIAGLDTYQVQTEVPVTDLPALKVGQRASVQADGLSARLTGSVISIGLTPDTGRSPVTYPLTIGLTGQPGGLRTKHPRPGTVRRRHRAPPWGQRADLCGALRQARRHGHRVRGGPHAHGQGERRDPGAGADPDHRHLHRQAGR